MNMSRPFARLRKQLSTTGVLLFASIAAVLGGYGLLTAMLIKPPPLGWIGFAIFSGVVVGLVALAPLAFERTRVSPLRPAPAVDGKQRLLVIADSHCDERVLCEVILERLGDAIVHVVVPVRVSHLHFVTDDEYQERCDARQSMLNMVGQLQRRAAAATGAVGTDRPLESMTDALGFFAATHVLLATPPASGSYWLEDSLLPKAQRLTRLPVAHVVVPLKQPGTMSVNNVSIPGHLAGRRSS